ncbi:MAG: hypothetical protein IPH43_10860 [Xanthomonadales bacterium]|nr:hypothetical protein [Xanthomonadales bacterium]
MPFLGLQSRLNHVLAVGSSILACGWVERGGSRNMMILRVTSSGTLDTTFSGNGYVEVDFNVDGERNDSCSRMVVLPNGDIVAGGIITDSAGNEAYGLTRLNSAGSFVGSFANQGRLIIDDGSALAATPYLTDIAWDSGRNRLMVACSLAFSRESGTVGMCPRRSRQHRDAGSRVRWGWPQGIPLLQLRQQRAARTGRYPCATPFDARRWQLLRAGNARQQRCRCPDLWCERCSDPAHGGRWQRGRIRCQRLFD